MNNILKKITLFDKDKKSSEVSQLNLEAGKGLKGDSHYSDASNQITVLFEKNLGDLDSQVENKGDGLCHARFKPNLLISCDSDPNLKINDEFVLGDAVLKITQPKHCFDECPLNQNDEFCHLKTGAGFAEVITVGNIKTL